MIQLEFQSVGPGLVQTDWDSLGVGLIIFRLFPTIIYYNDSKVYLEKPLLKKTNFLFWVLYCCDPCYQN